MAVELRLGEKNALANFRISLALAQLAILSLQGLHAILLDAGHSRALARIPLVLTHPVQQGLRRAAHPAGNRYHRRPLRFVLATLLTHQPHRSLPQLR